MARSSWTPPLQPPGDCRGVPRRVLQAAPLHGMMVRGAKGKLVPLLGLLVLLAEECIWS